jgi:hypothetical protein
VVEDEPLLAMTAADLLADLGSALPRRRPAGSTRAAEVLLWLENESMRRLGQRPGVDRLDLVMRGLFRLGINRVDLII